MATGDYDIEKSDSLPGVMVRKPHGSDPISDRDTFYLSPLEPILSQLHDVDFVISSSSNNPSNNKSWEWLHTNVGWIHVRFPVHNTDGNKNNDDYDVTSFSWHIDGGHFTPPHLNSPEQSLIILPMIRPVQVGGGNTLILKYMAQELHNSKEIGGIPREVTQDLKHVAEAWPKDLIVEMTPCDAGDVLLLHPFVVHAAGRVRADEGHPLRIAFNMGVRWKRTPLIKEDDDGCNNSHKSEHGKMKVAGGVELSWMEESLSWCLSQSLDFVKKAG